ncbi:hypothetical protein [Hymenobacter rubripertinctus]|uniref:Uncharacterized protein n=1 Tax=Hymenobacter rubripertinctus TaxID=2029981 RepID=A0A418QX83_9BACT|nr:hypothetical protein [Hymenobacter rubripertinctus]RIY09764.1 hypothetical protein D0T11_11335 [Hymenobacter rubripertinctus]
MPEPLPRLTTRLMEWFGLSQTRLGQCLGLSRAMMWQVHTGHRSLPLPAALPQAALTLALTTTPANPAPEPPDADRLRAHQRACQLRAAQLAFELDAQVARAAWARRRLAALPILVAALAPAAAPRPAWLTHFEAEARAELQRSGTTTQALRRIQLAGLTAEAEAAGRLLAPGAPA